MYYDKYVASQNTTEADVSAALSNSLHCQNFWTLWNCLKSPRYQMCNSWNLAAILDQDARCLLLWLLAMSTWYYLGKEGSTNVDSDIHLLYSLVTKNLLWIWCMISSWWNGSFHRLVYARIHAYKLSIQLSIKSYCKADIYIIQRSQYLVMF